MCSSVHSVVVTESTWVPIGTRTHCPTVSLVLCVREPNSDEQADSVRAMMTAVPKASAQRGERDMVLLELTEAKQ